VEPGYQAEAGSASPLQSATAVPLEGVDNVVGVLALYDARRDAYSKDHLRILLAISSKIGMAIQNALRFRMAESSATTDYLTGLPNARSLFVHLDAEISRARRTASSLTVFVCDLDGFKLVNDRFGHLDGNKVLKQIGAGFRDVCRKYDYVARMGGDEFVLVLPGLKPEDMAPKRDRLSVVAKCVGKEVTKEELLDVSVGWAHFPQDGDDVEQLLAAADKRMYRVKQEQKANRPAPAVAVQQDIAPPRWPSLPPEPTPQPEPARQEVRVRILTGR
jgi:diguanylate cyclase (GGDEF)-like protein